MRLFGEMFQKAIDNGLAKAIAKAAICTLAILVILVSSAKAFAADKVSCTDTEIAEVFGINIPKAKDVLVAMEDTEIAKEQGAEGEKARRLIECIIQQRLKKAEEDAFEAARKSEVSLDCSIIEVTVQKCSWYNPICNDDVKLKSMMDDHHYSSRNELASETKTHKVTTAWLCTSINEAETSATFVDVLEVDPFGATSTWFRLVVDKFGRFSMRDGGKLPERVKIEIRKHKKEDIKSTTNSKK